MTTTTFYVDTFHHTIDDLVDALASLGIAVTVTTEVSATTNKPLSDAQLAAIQILRLTHFEF